MTRGSVWHRQAFVRGWAGAVLYGLSLAAVPGAAHSETQEADGPSGCGQFFDKWDVEGAPAALLAMGGIGRETMAAQDCLSRNDTATACEHWGRIVAALPRLEPSLAADLGESIEALKRRHNCP